jgi:autotransporter family porin
MPNLRGFTHRALCFLSLGVVGFAACSDDATPGQATAAADAGPLGDAATGSDATAQGDAPSTDNDAGPTTPGHFGTLPVGAALPSDATCAGLVRKTPEIRADNAVANATKGTTPNTAIPRVTGSFVGTTDEILQWVACKWGIDEDIVRAQAAKESYWHQDARGDLNSDQNACYPPLRGGAQCPESVGLLQVRYLYHLEAFKDGNAVASTSYNADYAYGVWRSCFEGKEAWLNDYEKGGPYAAGDAKGCLGVWFSGRWRTPDALDYIKAVEDYMTQKIWTTAAFIKG